ncbi:MAG: T9SS type A sorting domain-containing protein [Chitinophagaceae bacterium]|nr:T9SS type A sorting domain-containing protein [Chitinophagaceae bacterium]
MKIFAKTLFLLLFQAAMYASYAQSCSDNLLTNSTGYYGGFEASSFSSTTAGTDYSYGMPRNGNYEIVKTAKSAGGGGYLTLNPHSGDYLMVSHTRSAKGERIWYKTVSVVPGATYQFCAWIANIKTDPVNGFAINLIVNGVVIASKTAVYGWVQLCGSYRVPAGVTSINLAIADPNAHVGPSHFLGLDDICFRQSSPTLRLGNLVFNDRNGNGVRDLNENVIPGVTVSLYTDNNSDNLPDGAAIQTNTTSSTGNYLFTNLAPGRYIASLPIIPGYGPTPGFDPIPDNNVDNKNKLIFNNTSGTTTLFTNAITLNYNDEPTTDGDDANGNLTFDLAECGNGNLGDFIWKDVNGNGIQESVDKGIDLYINPGISVLLTFPDGTTTTNDKSRIGDLSVGIYNFPSLGPGNYTLTFPTISGYIPTTVNVGGNQGDSDNPGIPFSITLGVNEINHTIDAGYKLSARAANPYKGIVEEQKTILSIFPNPAKSSFVVNLKSRAAGIAMIRILDASGKVVMTKNNAVIQGSNAITIPNLGKFKAGNYQVQVINGNDIVNKQLVIAP